jgi:hypothetical protein
MTAPFDPFTKLQLSPTPRRILQIVQSSTPDGIAAKDLRAHLWAKHPPADPKVLHVFVADLNTKLRPFGFAVRSEAGIYQLRKTRS